MPILRLLTLNVLHGASGREPLIADLVRSISPDVAVFTEARATPSFEAVVDTLGSHRVWSGRSGDRERVVIVSRWPIVDSSAFSAPSLGV
ncbi:MAG: hypothetical protein RLZZ53_1496 [Acidobacteriota bacterium]|jgi:hypothetical protein